MLTIVEQPANDPRQAARLEEIDKLLVDAAFQLVIDNGLSENANELFWRDDRCQSKAHYFKGGLLYLSEFYAGWNPSLSSAFWGLWRTFQYRDRDVIELCADKQHAAFVEFRHLAATAILNFADGSSYVAETNPAPHDMEKHEYLFQYAIESLARLGGEIRQYYRDEIA